jgi:uncharacterized membrane protein
MPNRSASWKETCIIVGIVSTVCLGIAIAWATRGVWIVLPFAGIEAGLLTYVAWKTCSDSYHRQAIIFDQNSVRVEWGKHHPKLFWKFPIDESMFIIRQPSHSLSAATLEFSNAEQKLEIGKLLNREDKEELIRFLEKANLPLTKTGEIQTHAIDAFNLDNHNAGLKKTLQVKKNRYRVI